ncbi:hypothetical protein D8X97_04900 [Listeria ivanovii]|nr:hypothetical protein [Listeria ivanovii]MBM5635935.1 hypothetical protein [Listeria ivanovii]MBM5705566.1 hypothetical protein [Listeria ivanovii]
MQFFFFGTMKKNGKDENTMPKKKRDSKTVALGKAIVKEYQPESVEEMESTLKDVFGSFFEQL